MKLKRADEHFESLKIEFGRFLALKPYRAVAQRELGDGGYVLRLEDALPVPDRVGLLIGDCAHNLRSSLDHITYRLSRKSGAPDDNRAQWPMARCKREFTKDRHRMMKDICADAKTIIERMQPYNGGPWDVFGVIGAIDNIDKHRRILVTAALAQGPTTDPDDILSAWLPYRKVVFNWRPLHKGDVFGEFWLLNPNDAEDQLHPDFAFDIACDEQAPSSGRPVMQTLFDSHNLIRDHVLPAFQSLV